MADLTREELAWLKRLQKVMDDCPSSRIGFYTVGDSEVNLYDASKDAEIDKIHDSMRSGEFCGAVEQAGASFYACLRFPSSVRSTAG